MYKQGLKLEVRAELMRTGTTIDTLQKLTLETIRLDNKLFELKLTEQSYTKTVPRENTGRNQRRPQPNQGRQRNNYVPRHLGTYYSRGPKPMHLDNLNKGKPEQRDTDKKV
jgi:hypothetical protein